MCIRQAADYARHGRKVAWFDMTHRADAFGALVDELGEEASHIRRTNGGQRIETRAGGSISFHSVRASSSVRGRQVDLIVLPDWQLIRDDDFMADLLPAFGNDTHPRIAVEA